MGGAVHPAGEVGAERQQVLEVGVMGGDGVVAIDAVLGEQLPVRLDAVLVGPLDDLHLPVGGVDHQVQVLDRAGEVADQILDSRVEAGEHESPVTVHPGHRLQGQGREVELFAVRLPVGDPHQASLGVEGPGVVEARERLGVAGLLPADHRTPMGAGVVEDVYPAGPGPPDHEHRPAADRPAYVVARVGHLRLVTDVEPRMAEHPLQLRTEHLRRGHRRAVDAEPVVFGVLGNQRKPCARSGPGSGRGSGRGVDQSRRCPR